MPYIKQAQRTALDEKIDALANAISEIVSADPSQNRDGLFNYSITRMLNKAYPDPRYRDYNEIVGMLECCKLEYYRKYAAPYEDEKESENGKVDRFDKKDRSGY